MRYLSFLFIVFIFIFISCNDNNAKNNDDDNPQQTEMKFRDVVTNLDTPWEILWGPDDWIWMTERYGRVSRVNPETGELKELLLIEDVFEDGERGLMGLVLHPDFDNNPYVFLIHNYKVGNESPIKIVRYTYDGSSLGSPKIIMDGIPGYWNHDGARLLIDGQNILWVTMGDRAQGQLAQDLSSLNGKILRMTLDGQVPPDMPFGDSYVWSYGHRNPQGLVFANGKVFSSEHGPNTDDEVNIIKKGGNYGWPQVKGYCDTPAEKQYCQENNVIEPIISLTPENTLAVAGMDYYDKDMIPQWQNSLLVTSLKAATLVQLKLNQEGTEVAERIDLFKGKWGRLRDVAVSPDGRVFIATSNRDGRGNPSAEDDRIIEISLGETSVENSKSRGSILNIYPNPADNYINFDLTGFLIVPEKLQIYNLLGVLVATIENKAASKIITLEDIKAYVTPGPGIYTAVAINAFEKSGKIFILNKVFINTSIAKQPGAVVSRCFFYMRSKKYMFKF